MNPTLLLALLAGHQPFTAWSPACPLELASTPERLPPAFRWAACADSETPCQELAIDGPGLSPTPKFGFDSKGLPHLLLTRVALTKGDPQAHKAWLVTDLEGAVRFSLHQSWAAGAPECTVYEQDLAAGRFVLGVRGDGRGPLRDSKVDGALIGRIGQPGLEVVWRDEGPGNSTWSIGPTGLVRTEAPSGAAFLQRDDRWLPLHPSPALPAPLRVGGALPIFVKENGYFEVGAGPTRMLGAWNAQGEVSRWREGAGNLGTDGVDLVWTEGKGAEAAIFTASVSEPTQARRLAPDLITGLGGSPFAVGCGHAAHWIPPASLRVVRLKDGRVQDLSPPAGLGYGPALGLRCNELIALAHRRGQPTLVRLPLLAP